MTMTPPKQETPLDECRRVLTMLKDHSCMVDRATHIRCYEFLLRPSDGPPAIPIKKPVVIVHQDDKGQLITLLGGPPGNKLAYGAAEFGLILCDIARHVARALGDESAVETIYEYFKKELDRPTTKLEGRRLS